MTFDPEKPCQTRDGRKARIICTDMGGKYSIIAIVECGDEDRPWPSIHGCDGKEWTTATDSESHLDLINIPEKRWAVLLDDFTWIQTYSEMSPGEIIPTNYPKVKCIACLEFTEGQGL